MHMLQLDMHQPFHGRLGGHLLAACEVGCLEIVKLLLERSVQLEVQNNVGIPSS